MTNPPEGAQTTLSLTLPRSTQAPATARRALTEAGAGLGSTALHNVCLLVSELVTNAVRHAHLEADDSVDLEVVVYDERVRVEVFDSGPGFVPGTPAPNLEEPSGWGLLIVDRVADRWGVTTGPGTRVWFELDLRPV